MCREEALGLASRHKDGFFGPTDKVKLVGVIKEVAGPTSNIETDKILGVEDFQTNYFLNYPVYIDEKRDFYKLLGSRQLTSQPLFSWNPFALWSGWQALKKRLAGNNIKGNLKGEGLLQGGVVVFKAGVNKDQSGLEYAHQEVTGMYVWRCLLWHTASTWFLYMLTPRCYDTTRVCCTSCYYCGNNHKC